MTTAITLITTPIFYVNSRPHLGHAFSMLVADAHARWLRKTNNGSKSLSSVKFSTGTDEHGQKIWQAAMKNNTKVEDWCGNMSREFKNLTVKLNISHSNFIRTSEPRHCSRVQEIWKTLLKQGDIYKGTHEGWYSISDETFYTEAETRETGNGQRIAVETGNSVEWVSEMNYRFKLAKYIPKVREWLATDPIIPKTRVNDLKVFLDTIEREQRDLSVSRRQSVAKWGIPVPNCEHEDEEQLIYVWLDALTNYLTVSEGDSDTAMVHIVGKDILKFHCVYWPAILSALGLPLPKRIIGHGHWTVGGCKMSKSLGNVVDPVELIDGMFAGQCDPLRYFLLRTGRMNSDAPFNLEGLKSCYNSELVGTLGNLISRVFKRYTPSELEQLAEVDRIEGDAELNERVFELPARADEAFDQFQFGHVADLSMDLLSCANRYISRIEPWKFADPRDHRRVAGQVSFLIRKVADTLSPLIPASSESIELFFRAYCDVYLTHDAPRVRKDHNAGWKHAAQVRAHFLAQNQDHMTRRVGEIVRDYEERGMPVFVPPPITIGRPPGAGPSGSNGPSGMMRPPPPPPMMPPGSMNFRPNMPSFPPMPPGGNPSGNPPQFFPFPPGVRPPFMPGMPSGMMPHGMMPPGMPGLPPNMPPGMPPLPLGMLPPMPPNMPFPPPPHMMMMPPRPPFPNSSNNNNNNNSNNSNNNNNQLNP